MLSMCASETIEHCFKVCCMLHNMLIDYYAFNSWEEQLEDHISRRQQEQVFEIEDFIVTEDDLLCREGLHIRLQIRRLRTARDL